MFKLTLLWIESEQHMTARCGSRRKTYCQATFETVDAMLDTMRQSHNTIYRNLTVKLRVNQYSSEINNNEM